MCGAAGLPRDHLPLNTALPKEHVVNEFNLIDPALAPIAERVVAGERLTRADGVALYASHDLLGIGQMADFANRRLNGDRVYFMVNRHINPTNICRNRCKFCAFARSQGEEGAYEMTLDAVADASREGAEDGAYEIHIVSGLHPDWSYDFYVDMVRRTREAVPDHVIVQAFTAVEIEHMAIIAGRSTSEVLADLKAAGLDALPGGGAEIFSERTRAAAWDKKTKSDDWLRIHGEAHQLGIATNATMLYGHIETTEERVDHLIRLREQQDRTGGFLAFIPLAFHPANTEMEDLPGTTGFDDLRTLAIARLMLDNIAHIKAFWIMLGLKVAQISTSFGVDDIDGTVVEERITHMAGASTPEALSRDDLLDMIRETGHIPVERDTLYRVVRVYDAEPCAPAWDAGAVGAAPKVGVAAEA
ncbi:MAG: aminofutalosine synthase MqnE [Coriobacteriales bacterium]|nr:aminofutalosine synthase MqnE [Coriobacteriales bacterium]